jgi:NADH-ubiquinone oxidoreductase chain 6
MINLILLISVIQNKVVFIGVILISTTLIFTIIITLIFFSWYSFILFLIYITGLLVIFIYFLAISPNNLSYSPYLPNIIILTLLILPFNLKIPYIKSKKQNFELDPAELLHSYNTPIYLTIAVLLLLILLIVVSLTWKPRKPIRHFL